LKVKTSFPRSEIPHHRFDDEVKDDAHSVFTPEMMKLSQVTWIETFVEGATDKNTGLSIFKEFVWFVYMVSGVSVQRLHVNTVGLSRMDSLEKEE
jgi:hypothetical protein